jgi:HSP20 family protein
MALIRFEPARELASLQSEMNQLFSTFFGDTTGPANGQARRWIPAMDLVETQDHFVVRADLPGLTDDDISIELEDNVLTISGERKHEDKAEKEGFFRVERAFGRFARTLTLPDGVDADGIAAEFSNGVLEVSIPKPEERKPRRVAIGLGGKQPAIEGAETAKSGEDGAESS